MKGRIMEEEKILQFINKKVSPEERKVVLEWISADSNNRVEYYRIKNLLSLIDFNSDAQASKEELEIFKEDIKRKKLKVLRNRFLYIAKYAAIILIAVLTGRFLINPSVQSPNDKLVYNEITVPPGQFAHVTLSDGSGVYINACSKLKYPAKFGNDNRRVILSGEAYFTVTKGKNPFLVEAGNRTIKVLGTKFNVLAYPNDDSFQTTLEEGKVTLFDSKGESLYELKPGEQYNLHTKTGKQEVRTVNTIIYDSWKDGLFIFDHETLKGLAKRLERVFAVRIIIENEKISNYRFSGTISRNVPFEQVLKIIQISSPIKYKLKEQNGTIIEAKLY